MDGNNPSGRNQRSTLIGPVEFKLFVYEVDTGALGAAKKCECLLGIDFLKYNQITVKPHKGYLRKSVKGDKVYVHGKNGTELKTDELCEATNYVQMWPRKRKKWCSNDYAVRQDLVDGLCREFGVQPEIDAFASTHNARFTKFWTRHDDAFRQDWSSQCLWINPPFGSVKEVLEKLRKEGGTAILIVPRWESMEWWQTFKKMVSEEKELPNDLPIYYNKKGELLPPPRWSTVAGLIIGGGEPSYIDFVQQREKSREVVWVVESANLRG